MPVITLAVPSLGNRTHVVHDGAHALVVDPPRDLRAVEAALEEHGLDLRAVADTHVHNDYVSGALGLARRHGADYLLSADESVEFERVGVRDGDVVHYGEIEVSVLATPGHTRHHQSFLARTPGDPAALLSGGSLLLGTVGRTDLVGSLLTTHLAGAQWDSARAQGRLDAETLVLPTHGFGSFCAASSVPTGPVGGADPATVGGQRAVNPALLTERETFVTDLVAGFGPVPTYYARMAPLNRVGAGSAPVRPARPVTGEEVADAVLGGSWVVDLRSRSSFAEGHVPGSVNVEYSHQFATYVGWLVPWDDDIVLLTDSPELLAPALDDLAAIGIDGVGAHVLPAATPLTAHYRRADWDALLQVRAAADAGERPPPVVIDVRRDDEWRAGHLAGALHLPVHEIERAIPRLPAGELWIYCGSGYRAGIAASLLQRHGRDVVHIDDPWERVTELHLPTAA